MYSCLCNSFYTYEWFADTLICAIMSTRNKHCEKTMLCVYFCKKLGE